MADKCLLFAYGLLQPAHSPPQTTSNSWRDQLNGELFDLGAYPVAVNIGNATSMIDGFVIEFDRDELATLDDFEDTESGEFVRTTATTAGGYHVYVYEYARAVPAGAPPIKQWPPPKT